MSFMDGCHRQGALYFAPASNSGVNRERVVRLMSVSALFANAFRNEAVSVYLERNFQILNRGSVCLLLFQPICEKAFFSELTAGEI